MFKRILIVLVAAAAMLAAPSIASATTTAPPLASTDTQAYLLDSMGNFITADETLTLTGRLTWIGAASFTCDHTYTVVFHADGTTTTTSPSSFTNCTTNIPGCNISSVPNLTWGGRLVLDSNGDFRQRMNTSLTQTYSGTCPYGPITYTGQLSPLVSLNGAGGVDAVFDGTNAGYQSSALGSWYWTGSLTENTPLGGYTGFGI